MIHICGNSVLTHVWPYSPNMLLFVTFLFKICVCIFLYHYCMAPHTGVTVTVWLVIYGHILFANLFDIFIQRMKYHLCTIFVQLLYYHCTQIIVRATQVWHFGRLSMDTSDHWGGESGNLLHCCRCQMTKMTIVTSCHISLYLVIPHHKSTMTTHDILPNLIICYHIFSCYIIAYNILVTSCLITIIGILIFIKFYLY